jgi:hypothetical protein
MKNCIPCLILLAMVRTCVGIVPTAGEIFFTVSSFSHYDLPI